MHSDAYIESERLLNALHELRKVNKIGSIEADAIRMDMETQWYKMTEDEQTRIEVLSDYLRNSKV